MGNLRIHIHSIWSQYCIIIYEIWMVYNLNFKTFMNYLKKQDELVEKYAFGLAKTIKHYVN